MLNLMGGEEGDGLLSLDSGDVGATAHEHAVQGHLELVDFGGVTAKILKKTIPFIPKDQVQHPDYP